MSIKVSVIIPVYNTGAEYLKRCVDSVTGQTYQNMEIILVDDGSSVECAEQMDCLAKQDDRIQVFHNENRGVSYARNYGVRKAQGKYITFVDSDDVINLSMIEHAIEIIEETGAQFVIGGVAVSADYRDSVWKTDVKPEYELLDEKDKTALQAHNLDLSVGRFRNIDDGKITRGPCGRLIVRELAIKQQFPESLKVGEDLLWNSQVIDQAERIVIVREVWYRYIQHSESVTHQFNPSLDKVLGGKMTEIERNILKKYPELQKNYDNLLCEEITSKYVKRYLMHEECTMAMKERSRKLRRLLRQYPFRRIMECPVYCNKTGIKILLIRTNLIFVAYSLKRIL